MKEIQASEFEKEVLSGGKVVLDFYSTECPPCEALAPKLDHLAELYGNKFSFLKIFRQGNRELAEKLGVKGSPTVLFFDQGKEVAPRLSGGIKKSEIASTLNTMLTAEEVAEIKQRQTPSVTHCEVAILGGGPGGLAAGLYLCQAKIDTILIDINLPGGQVATTHQVSNYPGFIEPQPGFMLSHFMSEQTKQCGTVYKVAVDVAKVDLEKKEILVDEFETIKAQKIIIATGASPRYIGIPGEKEYKGNGISYCATCDAKYFNDKEVVVIGGGNSAVEEADFITKFATKVTIIHQFDKFTANQTAVEKLLKSPKVVPILESEPRAFEKVGDKIKVTYENLKTKQQQSLETDGVFIFIGMQPNTSLFGNTLKTDNWGYLVTDEDMKTNLEGVYAIGDVRSKKYRQITTAVADGTIAAIVATKELDK